MAELDFEVGEEQMQSFDPIPVGQYEAMITNSEVKDSKSNNGGKILALEWTVMSGDYQGRKVFDNVNLANPNQQAVEIGRKQLNTISAACGYPMGSKISDSAMLHERLCLIDVKVQPAGPDKNGIHREARNIIRGYAPSTASGQAPPPPAAPVAPRPTPQPQRPAAAQQPTMAGAGTGGGKPPWLRK